MRIADVVKQATTEINQLVKEVRESDEDDPGKLAGLFDKVSERADQTANLLARADEALGGKNGQDDGESDEDEQGDQAEQGNKQQQRQRKQQAEA